MPSASSLPSSSQSQRASNNLNNVSMTSISDNGDGDGSGSLIEFPGIYQGFNLHSKAYILMTAAHCRILRNLRASTSTQRVEIKNMDKTQSAQSLDRLDGQNENGAVSKREEIDGDGNGNEDGDGNGDGNGGGDRGLDKSEQNVAPRTAQGFQCRIPSEKVPFGWMLGTDRDRIRLPFHALVRCTVNVETNEILHIEPA